MSHLKRSYRAKFNLFGLLPFLLVSSVLFAQEDDEYRSLNMTIDPDSYSMLLGQIDGVWNNKVGGTYGIRLLNDSKLQVRVDIGGFVNIHNFEGRQSFSWQLWRGNLGINTIFEISKVDWLKDRSKLVGELGFAHESQHTTDQYGYANDFMTPRSNNFYNLSARSFEYVICKINYHHPIFQDKGRIIGRIGYKYFPQPLISNISRILQNGYLAEVIGEYNFFKNLYLYGGYYHEINTNLFVASDHNYKGDWNGEPFVYRIFELGLSHKNFRDQSFTLFITYSNSNGRGLDFLKVYNGFGWGARMVL